MNVLLCFIFQLILVLKKYDYTYKNQVIISFTISLISLISMPFIAKQFPDRFGFVLSCLVISLQGLGNALGLNGLFSIVSHLPIECVISMNTGQSCAGILMNIIRYITLFSFDNSNLSEMEIIHRKFIESIIFFSLSALVCAVCLICVIYLYKNDYFIKKLYNTQEFAISIQKTQEINDTESHEERIPLNSFHEKSRSQNQQEEESVFKYLWDLNCLMFINYAITFSVFPGAALINGLFGMSDGFRINTLITVINIFDSLGRYSAYYVKISKKNFCFFVFFRLLFLFSYPLLISIERNKEQGNLFSIIIFFQMALFGYTSGLNTSLAFSMAPYEVPEKLVGKSGSCINLFLISGIFFGSSFALIITKSVLI